MYLSWLYATVLSNWISRFTGCLAGLYLPLVIREACLKRFSDSFGITINEAEKPLNTYESFNQFFTRSLKDDCRPIANADVVSPVDALLLVHGAIQNDQVIQAKGVSYSVKQLLGLDDASRYEGGYFLTFYLSPKDCHRIFTPINGDVVQASHIPSRLYPVREPYISGLKGLYTKNERLTTFLKSGDKHCAVVKVGATNVGCMTTTYDASLITNKGQKSAVKKQYPTPFSYTKGQWLATFHLGSTVVLCFEKDMFKPDFGLEAGKPVKYGESIGTLIKN